MKIQISFIKIIKINVERSSNQKENRYRNQLQIDSEKYYINVPLTFNETDRNNF